jgi:hypothetical protein
VYAFILCLGSDFELCCSLVQGVLTSGKNDYGTQKVAGALNGLEDPLKRKNLTNKFHGAEIIIRR